MSDHEAQSVLELRNVRAGYGRTTVLWDVDLNVAEGEVVALIGPNGAGKTTLLRAAAGLVKTSAGEISIGGQHVTHSRPHKRAHAGLCLVPEGRGVFPNLTVAENLRMQVPPWRRGRSVDDALDAFPILRDRLGQRAGRMSGGQQQMLALARCFLASPQVVLLDEVSMGLAPHVIDEIFEALKRLAVSGIALVLVEQYIARALDVADHVYVLGRGRINFSGIPGDLSEEELAQRYLAGNHADH